MQGEIMESVPTERPGPYVEEEPAFDGVEGGMAGRDEVFASLKEEWGADFDANMDFAREAVAEIADDDLLALFDETGLGDDLRLIRAAAEIGRRLAGTDMPRTEGRVGENDAALNAELDRLVASPEYWTPRGQRRARDIFLRVYGRGVLPVHRHPGDAAVGAR